MRSRFSQRNSIREWQKKKAPHIGGSHSPAHQWPSFPPCLPDFQVSALLPNLYLIFQALIKQIHVGGHVCAFNCPKFWKYRINKIDKVFTFMERSPSCRDAESKWVRNKLVRLFHTLKQVLKLCKASNAHRTWNFKFSRGHVYLFLKILFIYLTEGASTSKGSGRQR